MRQVEIHVQPFRSDDPYADFDRRPREKAPMGGEAGGPRTAYVTFCDGADESKYTLKARVREEPARCPTRVVNHANLSPRRCGSRPNG